VFNVYEGIKSEIWAMGDEVDVEEMEEIEEMEEDDLL
jgi:hypothetical protein